MRKDGRGKWSPGAGDWSMELGIEVVGSGIGDVGCRGKRMEDGVRCRKGQRIVLVPVLIVQGIPEEKTSRQVLLAFRYKDTSQPASKWAWQWQAVHTNMYRCIDKG